MWSLFVRVETSRGATTTIMSCPEEDRAVALREALVEMGCHVVVRETLPDAASIATLVRRRKMAQNIVAMKSSQG